MMPVIASTFLAVLTSAACLSAPAHAQSLALAAASGNTNTLKIGVIDSFTGASTDFGLPMLNGILLAVDEIKAVSRYLGRKLEVERKDD